MTGISGRDPFPRTLKYPALTQSMTGALPPGFKILADVDACGSWWSKYQSYDPTSRPRVAFCENLQL